MATPAGKVTLNVGGTRFDVYCSTLQAFPGTKLCSITEPQADTTFDYNASSREFFFDRSAKVFGQVLNYCRTKHLHCPTSICWSALEEELAFWEIPQSPPGPCCLSKHIPTGGQENDHDSGGVTEQDHRQGLPGPDRGRSGRWWARWQPVLWAAFEQPHSSRCAMIVPIISLLFNLAIIMLLCTKNINARISENNSDPRFHHHFYNITEIISAVHKLSHLHVELCFILWFMVEFFVRLTCCPDVKKFLRNPLNVVDFLSLFPVLIDLFAPREAHRDHVFVGCLGLSRGLYVVKLLKIFKLLEAPLTLRVLPFMLRCLLKEVLILLVLFIFEILFFGTLYLCADILDSHPEEPLADILTSFWWSVITLTTVGYGDVCPMGTFGLIVGVFTAIFGVLSIIVPIPIFFTRFEQYYDAALIREKKKRKRKEPSVLLS